MESNAFTRILVDIGETAAAVGTRRGELASAVWSVSECLSDLESGLVEFVWDTPLARDVHLAIGHLAIGPLAPIDRSPLCDRLFSERTPRRRWGLRLVTPDGTVDAHHASPEVLSEIIRALPAFLADYQKALSKAAGTSAASNAAREITSAIYAVAEKA